VLFDIFGFTADTTTCEGGGPLIALLQILIGSPDMVGIPLRCDEELTTAIERLFSDYFPCNSTYDYLKLKHKKRKNYKRFCFVHVLLFRNSAHPDIASSTSPMRHVMERMEFLRKIAEIKKTSWFKRDIHNEL
jgi:hypothetical protein